MLKTQLTDQTVAPRERTIRTQTKIVSEYDQEIPRSQTADKPMASRGRAKQKSEKHIKS